MTAPIFHFRRVSAATACALALAMGVGAVHAAGVAVFKEWDYHNDSTAKALAYKRIIETPGSHIRFVTGGGNIDVPRSKLADRIEIIDSVPSNLLSEQDVTPVRTALAEMKTFAARYPASAHLLEPGCAALAGHLARFDAGEVRHEGAWIARDEHAKTVEARQREAEMQRKREIEEVVVHSAQREKGLVEVDGKWLTEEELRARPPSARTALSDTLWPLIHPTLDGARETMKNLTTLAAGQKGAAKVRTERLHTAIRNLFLAEFRLSQQITARAAANTEAAKHDQNGRRWLKPNSFGKISKEAARESHAKAEEIRKRTAASVEAGRADLLVQLQEADIVAGDFYKLREHRVALVLGETVRAVAARCLSPGAFVPTFTDESLTAIREEMAAKK